MHGCTTCTSHARQTVVSRLERGESNPTVETLEAIAHGLGRRLIIALQ
ncbi:helix-turn-helix domain-containing protein [Raoultibacter massiliensis]